MLRCLLLVGAAGLLSATASAQGRVDVYNRDRKLTSVSGVVITSETLSLVKGQRAGRPVEYPTLDVVAIEYGPGSASFEKAQAAAAAGDWLNAESLFAAASRDAEPPWVAAHALLGQSQAALQRGKDGLVAAQQAIAEFLQRHPEHRLLPRALHEKARLAAQAGDAAAAQQAAASVLDLARKGTITPDWTARTHLLEGELRLAAQDTRAASEAFSAAESAAASARPALEGRPDLLVLLDELSLQARVGVASCMLAAGDVAGARGYYQRLAADAKGQAAASAAAANGLAECDFLDGKLKPAQLAFAKVALTSAGTPGERARSLYYLGRCAESLGQKNAEPDGRVKAAAYWQEVVQRYPDTRWARLARESLP